MPLLAKKIFNCVKSLTDLKPDEAVFTIPHTKEQFRSKDEFDKRMHLYKSRLWTCQSTGHVNLTHEEAWNSEKAVLKTLKEHFAPCYDKPVLELVHHSTQSLDSLVDQAWLMLQQTLVIGERVLLKVKSGGKAMKAIVVKSDKAGCERNPTSNCSSPSSDKENTDNDNTASPKKWVPPKLLPYKYSIRFENEDSVIHSVPACDLSRGDKPPSKELLRLFIRTYAVRAGTSGSSPWIVDDAQVKKLDLPNKFAGFFLSPVKWKTEDIAKKLDEEMRNHKSPAKGSPRIKTKMDAKEERKKEKAKKSLSKLQEKGERAKAAKEAAAKKTELVNLDSSSSSDESDSSDSSSDEDDDGDKKKMEVMEISDSDSDTPLSKMKSQTPKTPPKKKSPSSEKSKDKVKKKSDSKKSSDKKKGGSLADMKKKLEKKKTLTLADLKEQLEKKKVKKPGDKQKKEKGGKKKKGQDPKQLTLFDLSKKKGMKTPEKKNKSPQKTPSKQQKTPDGKPKIMSPPRTPAIVKKIQKAQKDKSVTLVGVYVAQAAKILSSTQRSKLPDGIKEMVQKKYDILQEKQKLARMSESERKEYLAKKAAKRKEQMRQRLKERMKSMRKRYEDTMLDLKPLPPPTLVATPEGLTNEAFGDVTMITEFISSYAGLLMPDDEYPIYTDALMKALTTGKEGFTYLSRVLVVLLQTLLQDQIAEDYQEIKVPLNDIPVNPCTTSELVRLCLRKQDIDDGKSESSNNSDEEDENDEVPDDLIQLLETQEFYQLEPNQKLQILKGLCLRIMGTYSVQDYMEEKQQDAARLWREKQAQQKENKDKRNAEKEEKKSKKETEKESKKDSKEKSQTENSENRVLLTHFYGKKNGDEAPSSGNTSEATEMGDEEGDLASVVKRRRVTAAQALEERRKKEIEDRIRRERDMELYKEQKEKELFEKQFSEGIQLAKILQRQSPIGTDRNHCRYWIFSDVTPGLFVEKGWVGEEIDYTCNTNNDDDDDSSSSSESEEEEEEGAATNKKKKVDKCVDKTFPHMGQNLWFSYRLMSEVDSLVQSLHQNGSRESGLQKEIKKRYQDISRAINKAQRTNNELRKCDGEAEVKDSFKKELLETELRLRNGGLGGVEDFTTWNCRLETSDDIDAMGECLLETQAAVLERFRDGIMVIKKRKKVVSEEIKEEPESGDEEEVEEIAPGIQRWREAVKSTGTFSRLHVLLGILDSCIKWEKSAENAKCKICRKKGDEDRLLLCDDCNQAFHMYCLRPALLKLPQGDWHCPACAPQYRKRIRDVPGRYKEGNVDSDDDEDIKRAKTDSIKHETHCVECGADENLIECAECPSVYHLECHDPPLRHPPRGRWVCNDCKNGITTRQRKNRQARQSSRAAANSRKRKRYEESSEEEEEESEEEEEEEEEAEESESDEPRRKAARRSGPTKGAKRGPKPKTSPKTGAGRPKGRKSVPSPEISYDPKPKVSRRAPSELSVMEDIVNQMLSYKDAWPFYHNVNKKDVPDYYDIIKQPISFQKIKDRLNCLVYGSPKEVIDAVTLLFRNGVEYNKIGSEVYRCLESSERHFVNLLKDNLPHYTYSREKMANGYADHMYSDEGRKSRRSK